MARGHQAVQPGDCRPRLHTTIGRGSFGGLLLSEQRGATGHNQRARPQRGSTHRHDTPPFTMSFVRCEFTREW